MTSEELDGPGNSSVSDAVSSTVLKSSFVWTPQTIALSILLFIAAGLLEVGGGWLVW